MDNLLQRIELLGVPVDIVKPEKSKAHKKEKSTKITLKSSKLSSFEKQFFWIMLKFSFLKKRKKSSRQFSIVKNKTSTFLFLINSPIFSTKS